MSARRVDNPATRDPLRGSATSFALAVAAPLAVAALAYALWWISDRLLYIGPLDRATFGWVVVMSVWSVAPVVAGFAWVRLTARNKWLAAIVVGTMVAAVASTLLWLAVAHPNCDFGAARTPLESVLPCLVVGLVIGAGLAAAGLITSAVVGARHPWLAVVVGAMSAWGIVFLAVVATFPLLMGPGCNRPPL